MKKRKKPRSTIFDDLLEHDNDPVPLDIFDDLVEELPPLPTERTRDIGMIMFWRREQCQYCHSVYEGSYYHTAPLLQRVIEKPIIHFGKLYGWRFHAMQYLPAANLSLYDELPRSIEEVHVKIARCRKCVTRPKVLYLPHCVGGDT